MYTISKYNYYVPYEERVIYLNGISMQVFSLSLKEHEKIQEYFKDLISFEINYSSVFKYLKDQGFIISEDLDEINVISYRHRKTVFQNRSYHLFINPTLECNFKCWYCYEEHPEGHMSAEVMERMKRHILYMIEKERIPFFHLSWFGGEPLLYFNEVVYPISLYAKELCDAKGIGFSNSITTNASKITPEMVDKMNEISLSKFQITIDGDRERHNKIRNENGKPSFDLIINNIILLCEKNLGTTIALRINYDNQTLAKSNLENTLKLIPKVHRNKIHVDLQRVWQTVKTNTVDNPDRLRIYEQCRNLGFVQENVGNSLFALGRTHKCYVDRLYHAEFNYDGKVYRCTARGYGDEYVVGELGEDGIIRWNEREMARRYGKAPFENEMCLKCQYLPLCLGPCSQKIVETSPENLSKICYLNFMEVRPDTIIIDYYKQKMKVLAEKDQN